MKGCFKKKKAIMIVHWEWEGKMPGKGVKKIRKVQRTKSDLKYIGPKSDLNSNKYRNNDHPWGSRSRLRTRAPPTTGRRTPPLTTTPPSTVIEKPGRRGQTSQSNVFRSRNKQTAPFFIFNNLYSLGMILIIFSCHHTFALLIS